MEIKIKRNEQLIDYGIVPDIKSLRVYLQPAPGCSEEYIIEGLGWGYEFTKRVGAGIMHDSPNNASVSLTNIQVYELIQTAIEKTEFLNWNERYENGKRFSSWVMRIEFADGTIKQSSGDTLHYKEAKNLAKLMRYAARKAI